MLTNLFFYCINSNKKQKALKMMKKTFLINLATWQKKTTKILNFCNKNTIKKIK